MNRITWGGLAHPSGHLMPAGDLLYCCINSVRRLTDRSQASAWRSTAAALRAAAPSGPIIMCSTSDQFTDQRAEYVAVFNETASPPNLRTIVHAPSALAQCLRLRFTGRQDGADPRRTWALPRRAGEALVHSP